MLNIFLGLHSSNSKCVYHFTVQLILYAKENVHVCQYYSHNAPFCTASARTHTNYKLHHNTALLLYISARLNTFKRWAISPIKSIRGKIKERLDGKLLVVIIFPIQ